MLLIFIGIYESNYHIHQCQIEMSNIILADIKELKLINKPKLID